MKNIAVILAILNIKGIGNKKAYDYMKDCDFNIEKIKKNIHKISTITLVDFLNDISFFEEKLSKYYNQNIQAISLLDKDYPKKLLNCSDPILYLFYKGNIKLITNPCLAIIGSRNSSERGLANAKQVAECFGLKGITIISGLAIGCDTYAHLGGLNVTKNNIAILPCGLDDIYPKCNSSLAQKILDLGGCLITEYLPQTAINKFNYVKRDRIQSALSNAIIVIEATSKSGTTNTVLEAKKQNKDIYKIKYDLVDDSIYTFSLNDSNSINLVLNSISTSYSIEQKKKVNYTQTSLF